LGLSLDDGVFILQRARYARQWRSSGCEKEGDKPVFYNNNIIIASGTIEHERIWETIITAAGGKVWCPNNVKNKNIEIDMVFVDALCLPPHETAVPVKVAKIFRYLSILNAKGVDVPIVDFSWAVQCIIQRKKVDIDRDKYKLSIGTSGKPFERNKLKLFSLKKKEIRYEVGDLVFFKKKNMSTTAGRILSIIHDNSTKVRTLEIQLMEFKNHELMDGDENVSTLMIDVKDLQKPILILSENDFNEVLSGWAGNSNICFMKRSHKFVVLQ